VSENIVLPTRRLEASLVELLTSLKAGERIKITQTVRVGAKKWPAETVGVFRGLNYLATGVTTDRVPEDDIIVPTVHFTKDNGELASISIDENTAIQRA
jgi:antitoxin (DNA-binding transcriptional repressor) of toxin-antitoxin stability system